MTMMKMYMEDDNHINLVRQAEYDFDRFLKWSENLDRDTFIVIDGTLDTGHLDRR